MRVIVTGGRRYQDKAKVWAVLDALEDEHNAPHLTIVQGGASGADYLARRWAAAACVPCETFAVGKDEWQLLGKAAGPLRNKRMVAAGADLVIAFPGGKGTADCVAKARKAGIPVQEIK